MKSLVTIDTTVHMQFAVCQTRIHLSVSDSAAKCFCNPSEFVHLKVRSVDL